MNISSPTTARALLLLASTACVAGCGESPDAPDPPRAAASAAASNGNLSFVIPAVSYGDITSLDVSINDKAYALRRATITIDGERATEGETHVGDVALVRGTRTFGGEQGWFADSIALELAVQGPVDSVDATNRSIVVLGQKVSVDAGTRFDASMPGRSLLGARVGDLVRVAGLRDGAGVIRATRIALQKTGPLRLSARGVVSNLDAAARRFNLGELVVGYLAAAFENIEMSALANGDPVAVSGIGLEPDGSLVASTVRSLPRTLPGDAGDRATLRGYVTSLDGGGSGMFEVAGLQVQASGDTVYEGELFGLGVLTKVEGVLDAAGVVAASKVVVQPAVLVPPVASRTYTVSGRVFDAYSGPVAHADVDLWIESTQYPYEWRNGTVRTDANGDFVALDVPDSIVNVLASREGFVQQCAVSTVMRGNTSLDVEMTATATLNSIGPPKPQGSKGFTLPGQVYELVDREPRPISAAELELVNRRGTTIATTRTDVEGRYFFCNLPWSAWLYVRKPGFAPTRVPIDFEWQVQGAPVGVELTRL